MAKSAAMKKSDMRSAGKTNKNSKSKKLATKTASKPTKKPVLKVVKPTPQPKVQQKAKAAPAKNAKKAPVKAAVVKAVVKQAAGKQAAGKQNGFHVGSYVVYPTHGVGRIVAEETQSIGEHSIKMLVISFEKDRMTLRVPVSRAGTAGLRHISGSEQMQKVFITLKNRARISRGMWSRRAQEYETKINSGNVIAIAEVVRDLHPNVDQAERSYSERMIYESALNRLVGELAAADRIDQKVASDRILTLLRSKIAIAA